MATHVVVVDPKAADSPRKKACTSITLDSRVNENPHVNIGTFVTHSVPKAGITVGNLTQVVRKRNHKANSNMVKNKSQSACQSEP
jgi:hypothetical protein